MMTIKVVTITFLFITGDYFHVLGGTTSELAGTPNEFDCCPDGWMKFGESCYMFVRDKKSFSDAEIFCAQKGGKYCYLWNPNEFNEWNHIRPHTTNVRTTWIGLKKEDPDRPKWSTTEGIETELMPWLSKVSGRGHVDGSDCVAYYQADNTDLSYIHFYPCNIPREFVCEYNATSTRRRP